VPITVSLHIPFEVVGDQSKGQFVGYSGVANEDCGRGFVDVTKRYSGAVTRFGFGFTRVAWLA
jgi:hypothetical protein